MRDGSVCLLLEGVRVNDQMREASVCLKNVRQIVRDSLLVDTFTMEYGAGEVLARGTTLDSVRLIVEWNDFEHHQHATRAYSIVRESVHIEVGYVGQHH